jgi:hypothetical protein
MTRLNARDASFYVNACRGLGEWWSYSVEDSRRNRASVVRRWHAAIERFVRLSAHPRRAIWKG